MLKPSVIITIFGLILMAAGFLFNFLAVPMLTKYIQNKLTYVPDSSEWQPLTHLPFAIALLLIAIGILSTIIGIIVLLMERIIKN